MSHVDDYQEFVNTEKQAKNLASLVMMILTALLLISYLVVPNELFGLPADTLKIIIITGASIFFVGSIYVRFLHVSRVENEY